MSTVYEIITNKIIDELEKGNIPWKKNWNSNYFNYITRKPYKGINKLLLSIEGFDCPFYLTFKQAKDLGLSIKKGAKASYVVFFKVDEEEAEKEDGSTKLKKQYLLRYYTVFNLSQTDYEGDDLYENAKITEADSVIENYKDRPEIHFGNYDRACYSPVLDIVKIPSKSAFDKIENFYHTFFHEIIHSTGHKKRLSRIGFENLVNFGSEEYSEEELVAEIGSCFLSNECGLKFDFENSLAYINGWLSVLKKDKRVLIFAASQAEKACNYVKGI